MESIEEKLLSKLASKFGSQPELDDELAFIGVDSVGMAELTIELENDFGIQIADDIVYVSTVRELVDYVRQQQANHET